MPRVGRSCEEILLSRHACRICRFTCADFLCADLCDCFVCVWTCMLILGDFSCADFDVLFVEDVLARRRRESCKIRNLQISSRNPPRNPHQILSRLFASETSLGLDRLWVHIWVVLQSLAPSVVLMLAK